MNRAVAVVVAALLMVPVHAHADQGSLRDPDEKPECEMQDPCDDTDYMDFRRVSFGHGETSHRIRHGLETRKPWKAKRLGGRFGTTLAFEFNLDGDRRPERQLRIRRREGKLRAAVFRGERWRKRVRGWVHVWRPDRRSARVEFDSRLLGEGVDSYRWRATWWQRYAGCIGSCGYDVAPRRGWVTHSL